MSKVKLDGKMVRPAFNFVSSGNTQLRMLESIRNCMEQIRDGQVLQCDVAYAIKQIRKDIAGLRRDLKKVMR